MVKKGSFEWFEHLPCSLIVCDRKYRILYMNDRAVRDHAGDGGEKLVGTDLMDCHPPEAQAKLRKVLASGLPNVYTSETEGKKKLVYQCPWRQGRRVGGLVQLVIELPKALPNHRRH